MIGWVIVIQQIVSVSFHFFIVTIFERLHKNSIAIETVNIVKGIQ